MPYSSSLFFSFSFPSDVIELSNNNTPARTSLMKRTEKSKFCLNHRPNIDLHLLPWEIHWRPVQRYDHRLQMLYLQRFLTDWLIDWMSVFAWNQLFTKWSILIIYNCSHIQINFLFSVRFLRIFYLKIAIVPDSIKNMTIFQSTSKWRAK